MRCDVTCVEPIITAIAVKIKVHIPLEAAVCERKDENAAGAKIDELVHNVADASCRDECVDRNPRGVLERHDRGAFVSRCDALRLRQLAPLNVV